MKIERVGTQRYKVGEGPVWDVAEQALYFVDLLDSALWRHDPVTGEFKRWQMPSFIGSAALRAGGGALVALQDGLHTVDLATGVITPFGTLHQQLTDTGCNDGKVDPRGRFLVGTQPRQLSDTRPIGKLYSVAATGQATELDSGFVITNGPCWSPDGSTLYFADSLAKTILAYDYDLANGSVANRRVFADVSAFGGMPDGATVDSAGRLWSAICGGGKVVCFRPDGQVEQVIELPVPLVGSVMFGGPQLDRLYVTTLNGGELGLGFPPDELGGALFVIDGLGAQGLPEHRYAG